MNQLTLEWTEAGQIRTQTITDQHIGKNPGTFRIGRDPARCDLVMQHPTVSKLHVELFFAPQQRKVFLRNLRDSNPPLVNRQRVTQVAELQPGTSIHLGDLEIKVKAIQVGAGISSTVVSIRQPVAPQAVAAIHQPQPAAPGAQPAVELSYGLQCPKCHRISPYDQLEQGCAWCGTSLAAASSVLFVPEQ